MVHIFHFSGPTAYPEIACAIVSGATIPWDNLPPDTEEPSEKNGNAALENEIASTELGQILMDIGEINTDLLRLSKAMRNPAPHERFLHAVSTDTTYFSEHDQRHVADKFPHAESFIITRLAKALSRRRQFFKYREHHQSKLRQGLLTNHDDTSTVASSIPSNLKIEKISAADFDDAGSESGLSQTSFADSSEESTRPHVPPLASKYMDGEPFECPLCFLLITLNSGHSWKKHVFNDLRPYVCLKKDCTAPDYIFARRHDWIAHEHDHNKEWGCILCSQTYTIRVKLEQHVQHSHQDVLNNQPLEKIISLCARSLKPTANAACPLCPKVTLSGKEYQSHVGRHQQDLSIFVLPCLPAEYTDNDEDEDLDSEASTNSSDAASISSAHMELAVEEARILDSVPRVSDDELVDFGLLKSESLEDTLEEDEEEVGDFSASPPPPGETSGEGMHTRENRDMELLAKGGFSDFFRGAKNEELREFTDIISVPSFNAKEWDDVGEADMYGVEIAQQGQSGESSRDNAESASNLHPKCRETPISHEAEERSKVIDHGINELERAVEEISPRDRTGAAERRRGEHIYKLEEEERDDWATEQTVHINKNHEPRSLAEAFQQDPSPPISTKQQFADPLAVPIDLIDNWYQDRRKQELKADIIAAHHQGLADRKEEEDELSERFSLEDEVRKKKMKEEEDRIKAKIKEEEEQAKEKKRAEEKKLEEEMHRRLAKFGFQENQIEAVLDPKKAAHLLTGASSTTAPYQGTDNDHFQQKVDEKIHRRLAKFGFQENQIEAVLDPKKAAHLPIGRSPTTTSYQGTVIDTFNKPLRRHISRCLQDMSMSKLGRTSVCPGNTM